MYPNVHCSTIYNSQGIEVTQMWYLLYTTIKKGMLCIPDTALWWFCDFSSLIGLEFRYLELIFFFCSDQIISTDQYTHSLTPHSFFILLLSFALKFLFHLHFQNYNFLLVLFVLTLSLLKTCFPFISSLLSYIMDCGYNSS